MTGATTLDVPDLTPDGGGDARAPSLRRRIRRDAQAWIGRHLISLVIVLPLLAVVGAVHGIGMATFPRFVDDPGTYL